MKKLIVSLATALMLVSFTPTQTRAEKKPISNPAMEKESAEVKALIKRVNEINAMDRSMMSRAEKREIRKELRSIKREIHRHSGGGVYISVGVLLLILILIIII